MTFIGRPSGKAPTALVRTLLNNPVLGAPTRKLVWRTPRAQEGNRRTAALGPLPLSALQQVRVVE